MDSELVQRTRYLLQARVRTAKSCPNYVFLQSCRHLHDWLLSDPLVSGILAPLAPTVATFFAQAQELKEALAQRRPAQLDQPTPADAAELAAIGLSVIRLMMGASRPDGPEASIALGLLGGDARRPLNGEQYVEAIRDVAIEAVYQFVDERIDDRNVTLSLLHKYKARSEWFRAARLRDAARTGLEGKSGERALCVDLHEYMHDQGVDFHVEPANVAGRPDVVSERRRGTRLVLDAKWVPPGAPPGYMKAVVIKGFSQVFSYLHTLNEPIGYLAIYNASDAIPEIEGENHDGFPCVRLATRSVYYVLIDLHEHVASASKRPPPKLVRISADEVRVAVETAPAAEPSTEPPP